MNFALNSRGTILLVAACWQLIIHPTDSFSLNHHNALSKFPKTHCRRSYDVPSSYKIGTASLGAGADIEQDTTGPQDKSAVKKIKKSVPGADIDQDGGLESSVKSIGASEAQVFYRGLVNEIDYCIAPADVSLSRAYSTNIKNSKEDMGNNPTTLSLTRALNNASNRAVRRILLVRCWPSPDALNLSLRLAAMAEKQALLEREAAGTKSTARCPVPRPILNVLMRRDDSTVQQQTGGGDNGISSSNFTPGSDQARSRSRTNEEYVADQIKSFRERYGSLKDYNYAEAYLESVLSLATSGEESARISEVMESTVYAAAYERLIAVLESAGAKLERVCKKKSTSTAIRISDNLVDQDICLSMLDKIAISREQGEGRNSVERLSGIQNTTFRRVEDDDVGESVNESLKLIKQNGTDEKSNSEGRRKRVGGFKFWKDNRGNNEDDSRNTPPENEGSVGTVSIVLSPNAPSMTRQLNSLSNIVLRALLFGGDQELLVLSETLASNRETFVKRWYSGTDRAASAASCEVSEIGKPQTQAEMRPGAQYLDALVSLLRECYDNGIVTSFEPFVQLIPSFSNSYERLLALTVELGSGYIRPITLTSTNMLASMPKPRTATEELGRFAVWESKFRAIGSGASSYPEDLEGSWEVRDEIGGETIGMSTVEFESQGTVIVAPPLQGLKWSLSPGPTHLDTCTFSVLAEDGTVLQYRGFVDRGARLEAQFSKRSIKIRGSVALQMRDGDIAENYWKGMLPSNYQRDTTKFVMSKKK